MSANLVFDPFRTGASMSETALLLTKHILNFRIEKLRLEPQNRTERLDQVTRWVFLASFTQGNQCWRSCHGLAEFLLSQRLKFTRNLQSPPQKTSRGPASHNSRSCANDPVMVATFSAPVWAAQVFSALRCQSVQRSVPLPRLACFR